MKKFVILFCSFLFCFQSWAGESSIPESWPEFQSFVLHQEQEEELSGYGYLVSGALAVVGGVSGYQSSNDALAKSAFALTQTLGLVGIGRGLKKVYLNSESSQFFWSVEKSSLSLAQKNEILRNYLILKKDRIETEKRIEVATFALVAAVNLWSASREPDRDVKNVFQFLAGLNLILALRASF